jgi:hypothetical protein
MAFHYSPKIVTDGLVFYIDALNDDSYPGSGIIANDLTANNNNGDLINGVGFDGESFVFDGVNDYMRVNSFNEDSNLALSIFCWVYPTNLTNNLFSGNYLNWIINKRNTISPNSNSWQLTSRNSYPTFFMWDNSNNVIVIDGDTQNNNSTSVLQLNKWQYVGITTDGVNGGFMKIYLDGFENHSSTLTGNRGLATKNMDIGKAGWDDLYHWVGNMSNISIYNRALSSLEVLQNYNALKTRYI